METSCEYTDDTMWISSDQKRIINRVQWLKEHYPDAVRIVKEPENNDGCIYATVPAQWLKISPPRSVNMSEEQKLVVAKRLKTARENRNAV